MNRYWIATMEDGTVITENDLHWSEVDISKIANLGLIFDGRGYFLPDNNGEYFQAKTAMADIRNGNPVIESRYVGFRLENKEYYLRVNELTGNCFLEILNK